MTTTRVRPPLSFDEPETMPAVVTPPSRRVDRAAAQAVAERHGFNRSVTLEAAPVAAPARVDGRSLRRTGRTVQMNVKVRNDVRLRYLALAEARGHVPIGQLLEEALQLLEAQSGGAGEGDAPDRR